MVPQLAYTESSLPGDSLAERLDRAQSLGLALEVVHREEFPIALYRQSGLDIVTVQAYGMHDFHPLHRDRAVREAALPYLQGAIEFAANLGVPRLVVVCGFGSELADRPFERSLDFFQRAIPLARKAGVRLLIEPLSPRRCAALNHPQAIARLVDTLDCPEAISMVLDTGHLIDSGLDLDRFFATWNRAIAELQLKGARSSPPNPAMPLQTWLCSLPQLPDAIAVEHRQPIGVQQCADLVSALRHSLHAIDLEAETDK